MFFDQPLEMKNEIPNDKGPKPMRGFTPWRVEEVGKLHHEDRIRLMTDSKVPSRQHSSSCVRHSG
jgi:hypothetical protein